ncbi:DUF2332 domain-containing protein [Roseococcus microcysteis]|uniref:DUF2332 domain-containing protein n=1 Tax=Roseococcus microcysteis TaxID=2771361 RepID=UPI00168BE76B|nr:DUF2332 domain-containing protein [Roseococcus microcysteis]
MSGTAARYRRFATDEAAGRSPLYEALALGVAGDADILAFLDALPEPRRQPNLLFAAFRHLHGVPTGFDAFRAALLAAPGPLRAAMLARTTQTNEPGRCAVLLPFLAALPQPLALIEVGASAGLCLLPDRYGYDYGGARLGEGPPVLPCALRGMAPPVALPRIAWRAGLDLNPLDPASPEDAAWLRTLVWPEQRGRAERLDAALALAAADPPRLVAGDLRRDLAALAAEAPAGTTRVIFHTAVLAYLPDPADRAAFMREVGGLCDVWIANEAPGVLPGLAPPGPPPAAGRFLLAVNGVPRAWTDPHGAAMEVFPDPS